MGKRKKKQLGFQGIALIVAIIFAIGIIKNHAIKYGIIIGAEKTLGVKVKLRHFSLKILSQAVHIKDFQMYNPEGFPDEVFVDIPEVKIDCNLWALLLGKIHLQLVAFDLKEMIVFKNPDGQLNVDALKIIEENQETPKEPSKNETPDKPDPSTKSSSPIRFQVDKLKLNIGRVIYKDYTKGELPVVTAYDVALDNKEFENIESINKLISVILFEALKPTAIRSAALMAASTLLGVTFIPAGIAGLLLGDDEGRAEVNEKFKTVYYTALDVVDDIGMVKSDNYDEGVIKGKVYGCDIVIKVIKLKRKKTGLKVTARKYLLPKAHVAEGVLYQVLEQFK